MNPDPRSLQHEEKFMFSVGPIQREWPKKLREVKVGTLHETVLERLKADAVPHMEEVKPYRPEALADHPDTKRYYTEKTDKSAKNLA